MAAVLERQKQLYLDEHGYRMTSEQEQTNYDIMVHLQGIYFCDKESIDHFGGDGKY